MATQNLVKRLQNIMRRDAGISGDAQRIEQMVWLFFLKVYDAQETEWEYKAYKAKRKFVSIIPEKYRWRNWAHAKDADGKDIGTALTGEELLAFINELFAALKGIVVTPETPMRQAIVREVFADLNQYQKNGILLRQVVNVIDEIDFSDAEDRHTFGDIYEGILKDLQSAGNAGEFYTPRALTDFIVSRLIFRDTSEHTDRLKDLRQEIDELDNELIDLLAKRMKVCRSIGEYKKESGMTIVQTRRYSEILDKRGAQGSLLGIDTQCIKNIFEHIHEESVRQQMEIINK